MSLEPAHPAIDVPALTPSQLDAARVIQEFIDTFGRPPSYQELADELGISKGNAHQMVRRLIDRGVVARFSYRAHGLTLLRRVPAAPECDLELTDAGRAVLMDLAKTQ